MVVGLLTLFIGPSAFAQEPCDANAVRQPPPLYTPDDAFPSTDGPVLSMHREGDALYLAGSFEHLGAYSGGLVALKDGVPVLDGSWPKVVGTVLAVESDGAGGWYIGGRFERVGSHARKNVAHLWADGTVDPCFAPGDIETHWDWLRGGFVHRIAVARDYVVLAGVFVRMGGQERNFLCAVSRADGRALPWNPDLTICWSFPCRDSDAVNDILLHEGVLYVAGSFDRIAGEARSNLAAFDAGTLNLVPWAPETDGAVEAVERVGRTVVIGGRFQSVEGRPRPYLAALNAETGRLKRWSPEPDGPVASLCADAKRRRIYVGGHFTSIGGRPRGHLARFALDPMKLSAWKPEVDGPVLGLALAGKEVLLCGEFTSAGGASRASLAALSSVTGEAAPWSLTTDGEATAVAKGEDGRVWVGGTFSLMHAVERRNLAAVNPTDGEVLDWNPSSDGAVREMEWVGDRAFLGGSFFEVAGQPRRNLACVGSDGTLLPWNPSGYFQDYSPYVGDPGALCPIGIRVFMGGYFKDWRSGWRYDFPLVAADAYIGGPQPWNPTSLWEGYEYGVNALTGDELHLYAYLPGGWNDLHKDLVALDPETAQLLPFPFEGWADKFALRYGLLTIAGEVHSSDTGEERRGLVQIYTYSHPNRFTAFDPGAHTGQERLGMPFFSGLFPSWDGWANFWVLVPDWLSEGEWTVGEGCCDRWVLLNYYGDGRVLRKGAGLAGRALSLASAGERVFVGGALRGPWPNLHPGLAATRSAPWPLEGLVLRTDPATWYQWTRDGAPIPEATRREFAPSAPGRYAVTVGDHGLLWTSPEVEVGP